MCPFQHVPGTTLIGKFSVERLTFAYNLMSCHSFTKIPIIHVVKLVQILLLEENSAQVERQLFFQ